MSRSTVLAGLLCGALLGLGCSGSGGGEATPPPAAPTGVSAAAGDGRVTVSWTASAGAVSYDLYYSTSASVSRTNGTKVANAVSGGAVSGLTNGSTYYFVVTAVNAGGESAESSPAASARPLPPIPAAPTGVLATAGDGGVTLTWSGSSGATSYNVYYSTSAGVSKATGTRLGGVSSGVAVGPLTNGTAYWFVVTAENLGGESAESSPAATATPLPPVPEPPLLVTATAGDAQAAVSWVASTGATSYNLYWSTSDTVSKTNGTEVTGAVSGGAVTGLANGSTYYFVVTAVNLGGESAESAPVASTTLVPAPPAGVSASAGDGQATVSWTASSGATAYNVYYSTSAAVSKATGTKVTGAVSGGAVTGLTNGTTYYFVVTAVNAGGESAESTPVASARPLPPVPAPPSGVAAAAGDAQVTVSWTASPGATSYNVYWSTSDTVSRTNGTQVTGVASGDAISGFANGTTYYFVVTAVNAGGESSESSPAASARPLPPLPAAPTGVTAATGLAQAEVSWTASPGAASYNLYYSTSPDVSRATGTSLSGAVAGKPILGLTPGIPYYFVVTAVDSFGRESVESSPPAAGTPLPVVLGDVAYSGAGGTEMAVDSTRKRVYVSGSIVQNGLVRIDASNPASMTPVTLPYGAGVAVDSQTGRYATTNGWGSTLFVYDATDNLVDTEALTGCPGTMDSDPVGGRFFVSTQCTDRLAVYGVGSSALVANVVSNGTGSGVVFDPTTGTAYQNLTPNSAAGGVVAPLAVTRAYTTSTPFTGYIRAAGGGRLYVAANNGDFVVRDSSSYATLRTFAATSFPAVAADVAVGVFYAASGGTITAYDATTYATAATITLPVTIDNMRMAPGDDRLYVLGGGHLYVIQTRGSGAGPATPTGVSAAAGNQQATVSWTASAGAASYNVYYSTSPSVSRTNGIRVAGAVSGGAIAGLVNGTTYYFVVTAVDSFGESAESAVASATPQPSDRVMVLLGWDSANNGIGSAQVYDASTNSWSAPTTIPAPNPYASSNAAVTVLANGQVMVAGGGAGDNYSTTNTVRLWTPSSGSWAYGPSMAYGRNGFALIALGDGTALAAGGCAGGCAGPNALGQYVYQVDSSSERYGGSSWTTQGTLTTGRAGVTSPLQLLDARVMVCGGTDGFSTTYSSCEFYRPSTGTWTSSAVSLPDPGARQMLLVGTKVLVLNQTGTASYYWDSASDSTFTHPATLPTPQPGGRMTLLADGRVMLVGGYVASGAYNALATVQIWSPTTNTWTAATSMGTARAYPVVVTLRDGRVFVAAGNAIGSNNSQPLASAEIWNPGTSSWTPAATSAIPRNSPSGVLLR